MLTLKTEPSLSASALVRVYLPTYRRPALLPRALASLQAQTMTRWVCELHNDDPADPFPAELVARLADPRITLVTHGRNLGATVTFNLFFQAVAEPFYSLLEDDNWWEPDFLATMLAAAKPHPSVTVFWANMRIWEEQPGGAFRNTGRTIWEIGSADAVQIFPWGHSRQICGALHSNGAALIRSHSGDDFRIPEVPFASIEPFRERMFPHPLMLIPEPLANFSVTLQTARSRDPAEWAEVQAMLAATFFLECPWDEARLRRLWDEARAEKPSGTTNLILASLAHPAARALRRHARWSDWLIVWRGFVRRPGLCFRILRSHHKHAGWWRFLEMHTKARWQEAATATVSP